MLDYKILPLGDTGLVIKLGEQITSETHAIMRSLTRRIMQHPPRGIVECVPAYTTLTLFYDPLLSHQTAGRSSFNKTDQPDLFNTLSSNIQALVSDLEVSDADEQRTIELPVCYGGVYAPDLEFVAQHTNLTPAEVVELHTGGDYLVYMIGFAPGFPYLGGLSPRLATPRRSTPRLNVPAGAIGIGGNQTGVYSIDSPGGWQLIGRTPVRLFRPQTDEPSLLQAGDRVRFRSITEEEFIQLSASNTDDVVRDEK